MSKTDTLLRFVKKVQMFIWLVYKVVVIERKFILRRADIEKGIYFLKEYFKLYPYSKWIKDFEPSGDELLCQKNLKFNIMPKISILTPAYNTPAQFIDELASSLQAQTYENWELCIADGNSNQETLERLKYWQAKDERIKVRFLYENKGIAENANEAYTISGGEYIGLLDHDDTLAPNALYEVVKCINEYADADLIYSDEDKLSEDGRERHSPLFKPDWSPDTLRGVNYICHFTVISRKVFDRVGGFRKDFDGSQDYDLFLRISECTKNIFHIPKVLYHWRTSKASTSLSLDAKPYCITAAMNAIREHLKRLGLKGEVQLKHGSGLYRVKYELNEEPLISIVIPNKDLYSDLKKCIDSIFNKSTYKNFEVIIVENNSATGEIFDYYRELEKVPNVKIAKWEGDFNYSAICNFGVKFARGEYIVLLNNDIEIITENWMEEMLSFCQRDDVGIVGVKLYYPDDTIQHAGVIVGMSRTAGHAYKHFRRHSWGYMGRLIIAQNLSAVTAACMMIKRQLFEEVGGLNEEHLKVAFNDIDLCLKVRKAGKLVVFTPFAEMYHYESKSRGYENTPEKIARIRAEGEYMQARWKEVFEKGDPYYNPNLTLERTDFSLNMRPGFRSVS